MHRLILNHIMLWSSPFRKKKFFSMPALAKQFWSLVKWKVMVWSQYVDFFHRTKMTCITGWMVGSSIGNFWPSKRKWNAVLFQVPDIFGQASTVFIPFMPKRHQMVAVSLLKVVGSQSYSLFSYALWVDRVDMEVGWYFCFIDDRLFKAMSLERACLGPITTVTLFLKKISGYDLL